MAFAPVNINTLSGPGLSGAGVALPAFGTSGQALDRLVPGAGLSSLESLAAPSALTAQFEQSLQTQQLTQLVGLLAMLIQNRPAADKAGQGQGASSADVMPVSAAGGSGGAAAAGATSQAGPTPKGNGSTVDRQGKPIGAHIAKQFDSMVAAAKQDGVNITITSGARSRAEQEKLYAAYKNGTGNLAAKPGTSNHESGDALDLGPPAAYGWLKQNAGRFGFKNSIPSEPWHWSLSGN